MTTRTFTDDVLDDRMAEILRAKTPAERLAMVFRLWDFGRQLIGDSIRNQHPDWSQAEVQRQIARRMSHGAV